MLYKNTLQTTESEKYRKWKTKGCKDKKGRILFSSKWTAYDNKKSRLIKEQEASGLLKCLGIKVDLRTISLLVDFFFKEIKCIKQQTSFYQKEIYSCRK